MRRSVALAPAARGCYLHCMALTRRGSARRGGLPRFPSRQDDADARHLGLHRPRRAVGSAEYAPSLGFPRRFAVIDSRSPQPQTTSATSLKLRPARRASSQPLRSRSGGRRSSFHTPSRSVLLMRLARTSSSTEGAVMSSTGWRRRRWRTIRLEKTRRMVDHGSASAPGWTRCVSLRLASISRPCVPDKLPPCARSPSACRRTRPWSSSCRCSSASGCASSS